MDLIEEGQTQWRILVSMVAQSPLVERIKEAQANDKNLKFLSELDTGPRIVFFLVMRMRLFAFEEDYVF